MPVSVLGERGQSLSPPSRHSMMTLGRAGEGGRWGGMGGKLSIQFWVTQAPKHPTLTSPLPGYVRLSMHKAGCCSATPGCVPRTHPNSLTLERSPLAIPVAGLGGWGFHAEGLVGNQSREVGREKESYFLSFP